MAKQTQGISEKTVGNINRNPSSTDKEVHRMPPLPSPSSKTQQIQTGSATWQSSGQERHGHVHCVLQFTWNIIDKSTEAERLVVARDGVAGERWSVIVTGNRVSFWSDGTVLELDTVDGCTVL